jgi:hypothetical protein
MNSVSSLDFALRLALRKPLRKRKVIVLERNLERPIYHLAEMIGIP